MTTAGLQEDGPGNAIPRGTSLAEAGMLEIGAKGYDRTEEGKWVFRIPYDLRDCKNLATAQSIHSGKRSPGCMVFFFPVFLALERKTY